MSIANQYKLIAHVDTLYTGILYLATGITMVTQYTSVANRYICTATCHVPLGDCRQDKLQVEDTTILIYTGHSRKVTYGPLS